MPGFGGCVGGCVGGCGFGGCVLGGCVGGASAIKSPRRARRRNEIFTPPSNPLAVDVHSDSPCVEEGGVLIRTVSVLADSACTSPSVRAPLCCPDTRVSTLGVVAQHWVLAIDARDRRSSTHRRRGKRYITIEISWYHRPTEPLGEKPAEFLQRF